MKAFFRDLVGMVVSVWQVALVFIIASAPFAVAFYLLHLLLDCE